MIDLEVRGGKAKQRQIVEDTALFCIDKLLPDVERIEIDIHLKDLDEAYGYALNCDDSEYELQIKKNLPLYDLISTVCHEMVHVKQYELNELSDDHSRWKSRKITKYLDYMDKPWEKEAFKLEDALAIEFFQTVSIKT